MSNRSVEPRMPPQYDTDERTKDARERDIVLRWFEGIGAVDVGLRYGIEPEAVLAIVNSPKHKKLRDEIRQRAIDYTLERFDHTAPQNLEILVKLRDHSVDEKMQRLAALDLLEYSSLKKSKESNDSNIGAELVRGLASLARELDPKKGEKPDAA